MNLLSLGVQENMSASLQNKTRLTNQVAVMCAIIGVSYVPFLYIHYPALAVYPAVLFVISCLTLLGNHLGLVHPGRFISSFQMITLATLFHASILREGEGLLVSFFCTQLAMTLIPWLLYDLNERVPLAASLTICYGLLVSQQVLNGWLEVGADSTYFRNSYLNPMTFACAAAIQVACVVMMKSEKQSVARQVGNKAAKIFG
jgi:hypothetical protein